MLRLEGEVVRYERKPWAFDGKAGVSRVARVLQGRADFTDVYLPDDFPEPRDGDVIDWCIVVTAYLGKARLTVVGPYVAPVYS